MSLSDDLAIARHYVTGGFEVGHLDLGGLDVPHITDARAQFLPLLEHWQRAGLVVMESDVANLTLAGRFWYSNLIAAFNDIITSTAPVSHATHGASPPHFTPRSKTGDSA